jgi:GNAT superfamily N-acetyltransferase
METIVRKGREEDLPAVLELVKELAEYEKAAGEVEVTLEQMRHWSFGEDPVFEFFVLSLGGKIAGMALYYYKYSTWKGKCLFLEDLIVTEAERCKGYGSMLFEEVLKVARSGKVKRMEWQVLDWNEPAISFYKRYHSKFDPEWLNCRLTAEQLH